MPSDGPRSVKACSMLLSYSNLMTKMLLQRIEKDVNDSMKMVM